MNKRFLRYSTLTFIAFALLVFCLLISCSEKKAVDKKNLIPEKELVSLLTDIYIADGLMSVPSIRTTYGDIDSILNYIDIIESHGFSKAVMDKTMKYYFYEKPKKLITIYDQVLAKLSEMESVVDKQLSSRALLGENLWVNDTVLFFPDTNNDTLWFDLTFKEPQFYSFAFTMTLFPDDPSENPRFTAYFCHPDSIYTGKRDYFPAIRYIKDGRPHRYRFYKKPVNNSYTYLRGSFIDNDNNITNFQRHASIEDIIFSFTPAL